MDESDNEKTGLKAGISNFLSASRRIFIVSKKPDNDEYRQMAKVTGIGIILLGIIGFIVMFFFLIFGMGK